MPSDPEASQDDGWGDGGFDRADGEPFSQFSQLGGSGLYWLSNALKTAISTKAFGPAIKNAQASLPVEAHPLAEALFEAAKLISQHKSSASIFGYLPQIQHQMICAGASEGFLVFGDLDDARHPPKRHLSTLGHVIVPVIQPAPTFDLPTAPAVAAIDAAPGGHVRDTDFSVVVREPIHIKPEETQSTFKSILNIIEDVRIERRLLDQYPGVDYYLGAAAEEFLVSDEPPTDTSSFWSICLTWLLYAVRCEGLGQTMLKGHVEKTGHAIMDAGILTVYQLETLKTIGLSVLDKPAVNSTMGAVGVSKSVFRFLDGLSPQEPPQDGQQQPQSGQGGSDDQQQPQSGQGGPDGQQQPQSGQGGPDGQQQPQSGQGGSDGQQQPQSGQGGSDDQQQPQSGQGGSDGQQQPQSGQGGSDGQQQPQSGQGGSDDQQQPQGGQGGPDGQPGAASGERPRATAASCDPSYLEESMPGIIREFEGMLAEDGSGRIVNVTGASGMMAWMPALNYGMNNAAVIHATRYLAADLAGRQITVNTVVPGIVGTEWRQGWAGGMAGDQPAEDWLREFCGGKGILARRWARVEEIGDAIAFLASARAGYITGTQLVVDGGLTANVR
ncbi:SDR family NAD(P)-dependent oxidoreductase [Paracoccus sanguinis]|uniref:SDR family NAD(P)-dependent oxidoreductase n=1 Tax=Paracoccus sanguinis TaxID=1545044 RepID=UPI00069065B0|nr:SDR family oxidoreductase [Paracoccus sanguinis]